MKRIFLILFLIISNVCLGFAEYNEKSVKNAYELSLLDGQLDLSNLSNSHGQNYYFLGRKISKKTGLKINFLFNFGVGCIGLRSDNPFIIFAGIYFLFESADNLVEIKKMK